MPNREIKLNLKHKINTRQLRQIIKLRRNRLLAQAGGDCNTFFANCCNCCGGNPATCDCNQIICRDWVKVSFPGGWTGGSGPYCYPTSEFGCDCSTVAAFENTFSVGGPTEGANAYYNNNNCNSPNVGSTGGYFSSKFIPIEEGGGHTYVSGGAGCVNSAAGIYFCSNNIDGMVDITAQINWENGNGGETLWKTSVSLNDFGCGANTFTLPPYSMTDCCQTSGNVTIEIPATNPDYCAGCKCCEFQDGDLVCVSVSCPTVPAGVDPALDGYSFTMTYDSGGFRDTMPTIIAQSLTFQCELNIYGVPTWTFNPVDTFNLDESGSEAFGWNQVSGFNNLCPTGNSGTATVPFDNTYDPTGLLFATLTFTRC